MKDLLGWQKELKQKEKTLKRGEKPSLPPVRGRAQPAAAPPAAPAKPAGAPAPAAAAPRHPAGHTYDHYRDKWEKFDMDAALASDDEADAAPAGGGSGRDSVTTGSKPPAASATAPVSSSAGGDGSSGSSTAKPSMALPAARIRAAAQAAVGRQQARPTTAEGWKEEGNRHFKAGAYQQAGGVMWCGKQASKQDGLLTWRCAPAAAAAAATVHFCMGHVAWRSWNPHRAYNTGRPCGRPCLPRHTMAAWADMLFLSKKQWHGASRAGLGRQSSRLLGALGHREQGRKPPGWPVDEGLLTHTVRPCGLQALDCYSSSLALAPTCLAYANRAMAELKLGQFREAEADCTQALRLDPLYVKAYQRR
jgi:hypothetical protein